MTEHPRSAVSIGSGVSGSLAMSLILIIGLKLQWSAFELTCALMVGTASASVLWDVLVDKVHLRPSTGLDWSSPRPLSDISGVVAVKLVGLVATFGLIAFCYQILNNYQKNEFTFYFWLLSCILPVFLALCPIYVLWTTRYMIEPRDKLWHFGRLVLGGREDVDIELIKDHLIGWGVKAFFLAFLVSVIPAIFGAVADFTIEHALSGIVPFFGNF